MKKFFTPLVLIFIGQVVSAQTWVSKSNFGGSARSLCSSFSIPSLGKGYVVGGSNASYLNDVWAYDTLSDSWSQVMNFPGLPDAQVAFTINELGYVGTGVSGGYQWSNAFYVYDPVANTWTAKATFPGVPRGYAVGFAVNGKGYIGGGSHGYNFNSSYDFYEYDPTLDTWTRKANCPALGCNHCAVGFALNGKGYVGTGSSLDSVQNKETVQQDFWEYDPTTDTWTAKANFGGGTRAGAIGFATCDKAYVGCGYTDATQNVRENDFWEYNPVSDTWTRIADMGTTGMAFPNAFTIGKSNYVGNGSTTTGYLNSWYKYQPVYTPSFTTGGASPTTICTGQSVSFTDTTNYSPTNWQWSFPGGTPNSSNQQNPTITYNTPGNYDVILSAWNGCDSGTYTATQYITVNAGSAKVTVNPSDTLICSGSDVQLHASGATTYSWLPNATLNDTTSANPYAAPTTPQVYTVIGISGCGADTEKVTVNVTPTIQVSITPSSATGCSNTQVPLSASGATTYSWSPISGLDNPTSANPVATLSNNITYTVTGSTGACTGTDSVVITVGNTSTGGAVTAVRDTICLNTPGNLTLTGNSSNTVQWQSSTDDITFNNTSTGGTSLTYKTSPLQQSTWYRVLVGTGNCSAFSDTLQLYVPPALTASFYYTQAGANQLTFNSDSSIGNIRSYHWDFGDGQTSNDSNPSHTFAKDTTYYVCLTLYDGSNCSYTFCRYSSISDGVQTISAAGNWVIYPNPFTNELTVGSKQLAKSSKIQSIEMYDVLGRVVLNEESGNSANTTLQLDVSSLAKGMYYVMIRTADADYVQKVVKQ